MTSQLPGDAVEHSSRADHQQVIERVRWRSRRGLLELELLLLPFLQTGLTALDEERLASYARLLECDDWDIFEWLQERATPPAELAGIVAHVRRFLPQARA